MKKIAVIGTVGVPACYGGFESLVENMLDYTPEDIEYTVFCSSKNYKEKLDTYKNAKLIYLDMDANGPKAGLYDLKSMKMAYDFDFVLILGYGGCLFLPFIIKKFKGKLIINIDGIEWKRDKWNFFLKTVIHMAERMAIRYADVIIGDNQGIIDYVKEAYKKDAYLIAYGGDNAKKIDDNALYDKYPFCKSEYAITVCRIEPENNIHKILEAVSKVPDVNYVIVGNWNKSEYGRKLKTVFSEYKNIHILDPIYDTHTINWIRGNGKVYIHGHSAGGTNPSLVEAMNLGLPIISYDCVYNRYTTKNECIYWSNSDELAEILQNDELDLSYMGNKMKEIGEIEYSWKNISNKYNELWK